jgi:hypothetical protein
VELLVDEALRGKHRQPAVEAIFDRLEGRSTQRLDVNDVTADFRSRSDAELGFHTPHNRWPAEGELSPTLDETRPDGERGKSEAESLTAYCVLVLSGPDRSQASASKAGYVNS